ncbi:MAG: thiol:disulfide interchange protein DsbA/DsbL [Proteobacteria bacterium]|nr:thiol:disulfide interchange protein DsbA/DsbL [Pseudomonadota bacterium]
MSLRTCVMTLAMGLLAIASGAAIAAAPVEGTDYRVLKAPGPPAAAARIEVVEFFSYACPHCAHFYPMVAEWLAREPKDVQFRRVPVGFERPQWVNLARAFYALQVSGDFDKLDGKLFKAIHEESLPLFDQGSIADWVGRNGGDADKFALAYGSFGVNNQTVQADALQQSWEIDSVPNLVVDGKYVVMADASVGETQYLHDLLTHADAVIAMVRTERHMPAPAAAPAAKPKAKKS